MLIVNRKNDRIIGALEGEPFNILFDVDKYEELKVLAAKLEVADDKAEYTTYKESVLRLIEVNFNEEVAEADGYLKFNINKGTYHLVINKGTKSEKVSKDAIPEVLANSIIETYAEGGNFRPLLLAWMRFLNRENKHPEDAQLFANYLTATFVDQSRVEKFMEEGLTLEAATELSTFNDIAITTQGLLATYKVVDIVKHKYILTKDEDGNSVKKKVDAFPSTETVDEVTGEVTKTEGKPDFLEEINFTPAIWKNGDKFFSNGVIGYKYKIGEEAVLPDDAKRNLSNSFGGGGLYAGGLAYIQGYSSENNETLTCFIDPSEIISFQSDGLALRTNRLFVNGAKTIEGELSGMYFASDYAKESTERINTRFKDTVLKTAEKAVEVKETSDFKADMNKSL